MTDFEELYRRLLAYVGYPEDYREVLNRKTPEELDQMVRDHIIEMMRMISEIKVRHELMINAVMDIEALSDKELRMVISLLLGVSNRFLALIGAEENQDALNTRLVIAKMVKQAANRDYWFGLVAETDTDIHPVDKLLQTHPKDDCEGRPCVIHNQSSHQFNQAPKGTYRPVYIRSGDRGGSTVWMCEHRTYHPDPDDLAFWASRGEDRSEHECDGCCEISGTKRATIFDDHGAG